MKILLIEDDNQLAESISASLTKEKYLVERAESGEDALDKIHEADYDIVLLDIMLPGIDGFEVLKTLRGMSVPVTVLVLSARGLVEDRVKGLDLGAEDYLTKPFAVSELLARIRTLLRRKHNISQNTIQILDLEIDTSVKKASRRGYPLNLSPKEYEILEFLAYNKDRLVTRIEIGEHIWGESLDLFTMSNFIDVHIKNLRKKLDNGHDKLLLHTKRGFGFILTDKDLK